MDDAKAAELRERSQAVAAELAMARRSVDQALAHLARVAPALAPHLSGQSALVPSLREDHRRGERMTELIAAHLDDGEEGGSLDLSLAMLDDALAVTCALVEETRAVAVGLFETVTVRDARGEQGASAAVARVGRLLDDGQRQLDKLKETLPALKREARNLARATRWREITARIDESTLERWLLALVKGEGELLALAEREGIPEELRIELPEFVLTLALRLESEIADQGATKVSTARDHADETPAHTAPLCVKLHVPDPVGLGDCFDLVLSLRNDTDTPTGLDSVDLDGDFLSGFALGEIQPEPQRARTADEDRTVTLGFEEVVAPGESVDIRMSLRAESLGNFTGEVSVWTSDVEVSIAVPNIDVVLRQ